MLFPISKIIGSCCFGFGLNSISLGCGLGFEKIFLLNVKDNFPILFSKNKQRKVWTSNKSVKSRNLWILIQDFYKLLSFSLSVCPFRKICAGLFLSLSICIFVLLTAGTKVVIWTSSKLLCPLKNIHPPSLWQLPTPPQEMTMIK